MKFECTECEIEFKAEKDKDGYLPSCPRCNSDYRVFETEDGE